MVNSGYIGNGAESVHEGGCKFNSDFLFVMYPIISRS